MIDSALGLDPDDSSDQAKAKRCLRGLADLSGISFVAKIMVEPNQDQRYPDQNKLERAVLPNEKEWQAVMKGESVPASPSRRRGAAPAAQPAAAGGAPAWADPAPQSPQQSLAATWQQPGAPASQAPSQAAKPAGPAWLNP